MNTLPVLAVVVLGGLAVDCGEGSPRPPDTASAPRTQYLGSPTAANATPVLASTGRWLVAVWTATEGGHTDLYAATSDTGGLQFRSPVRVNDADGEVHVYGEDPPRVATDEPLTSGAPPQIIVTWPSDRAKHLGLRSSRSVDGGRTFSSSASIGDVAIDGERGFQSVTIGPDHVVHAAWLDERRDSDTPRHANSGEDWDPMHLMYASTVADGGWSAESRLASNVCGCCKTAIATRQDGSVYVAFRNIYPGNLRDISFAFSRNGHPFSSPVRVSEDHWALNGCPDDGPAMLVDRAGTVHLIWPTLVDGPEPAIRFFHASTRDGLTFTPRQMIETLGTPKPSHPQMTLDACGGLALVWDEARGTTRRAVMRRLVPLASGDVQAGDALVLSGDTPVVYPVIASTNAGLAVAWTEISKTDDRSRIAMRRLALDASCSVVPTDRR